MHFFPLVVLSLAFATIATPSVRAGEALVANGNFETDANGDQWPDGWPRLKTGGSWEEEGGNHFLRLTSGTPGEMILLYHSIPVPATVKAIEMTWRMRVSNLKKGKQPWFDARIMMDFKDAAGNKLKGGPPAPNVGKSTEGWIERSAKFLVPEGARSLDFMPTLFQVESGTFDLDDVVLTATDPEPLKGAATAAAAANEAKLAKVAEVKRAKAAAAVQPDGSLLPNGDFETDKNADQWPDTWGKLKAGGSWETEDGNHFLRITSTSPGEMISLYRVIDLPAGTKALELTWRQRVTDFKKGKQPWFDARIMMEFKDAAGKTLPNKPSPPYTQKDTKGWEPRSAKFLVPDEAVSLVFMPALFQAEKGKFDLDDIVLKPTDPEALIVAAKAAAEADKRATVPAEAENKAKWPQELHVEGRRVLNKDGKEVWLQGINAGGLETLPQDKHVMKSAQVGVDEWKANIVRLPVKEEFWFGHSPFQKDGGKGYRDYVDSIVTLVANRGAYLLLDLHRFRAPKAEHVEFWKDAGAHYKNHPAVLFDLFNEPHGISWEVWRDGGFVAEKKEGVDESAFLTEEDKIKNNAGFRSPGMQALVNAVRESGARNIVVAGGLFWANDLSGIATSFALKDPNGNGIIYSWHVYNWHNDWQGKVLGAAEKFPILVGELGADTNKMDFIPSAAQEDPYTWVPDMLGFIQKHKLHWTGWCMHPKATPILISDWDYTPTPFWGAFAKRALAGEKFEMKRMR